MKALFIIVLAAFSCFAGYRFAYDELLKVVDLAPPVQKPLEPSTPVVVKSEPPPPPKIEAPKVETPKPVEAPKPIAATEAPKVDPKSGLGMTEKDPDGFEPPKFQTIEEITKNWKEIPKNVLANQTPVKLAKDVEFKMGAGALIVKAGATAFAIGQEGDDVVLAPAKDSPGRASVPLDDTDLKAVISSVYKTWMVAQIAYKKREWAKNAKGPDSTLATTVKTKGKPLGANTKPSRNPDGSYAVLLESMKSGQVREITPQNIKKWGEVAQETIDGKEYWTVLVNYTTKTMFGDFDVEAQARIFGGKVDKWVYTGSGEVVP